MEIKPTSTKILHTEWGKINYRRTFSLIIQICAESVKMRGDELDWVMTFSTGGVKTYTASRKGSTLKNCNITSDGRIRVIFKDHELEAGRLSCELVSFYQVDKTTYTDRHQFVCGVELVGSGCYCDMNEYDIDVLLPYLNVGMGVPQLWEELSLSDENRQINVSHLEGAIDVYKINIESSGLGEGTFTYKDFRYVDLVSAIAKGRLIIVTDIVNNRDYIVYRVLRSVDGGYDLYFSATYQDNINTFIVGGYISATELKMTDNIWQMQLIHNEETEDKKYLTNKGTYEEIGSITIDDINILFK